MTELKLGAFAGTLWGAAAIALGGIDTPIKALFILTSADFITGVIAGYRTKNPSSSLCLKGILKKVGLFIIIMFAFCVDCAMQTDMLRGMVISAFAVMEAISITENLDRMGLGGYIPSALRAKLQEIKKERGESNEKSPNQNH